MVKCPNKNHPEWKELERLLPNQAYVVWDAFPHGIDKAPNGADSKLFKDLLEHYEGDRDSAIRAKAKTVTNAFKTWFGDWTIAATGANEYDTLSESDIIFGHPGIGKTYSFENGKFKDKFIDWDVEYNEKRDKWIEEHSGTKKGTAEYKKARNEYLIYPERHSDYIEFLTNEWNRVKEKAKKEGKILFASPHNLLKLFPQDFTRIINLSDEDFIKRDINRGGDGIKSKLWKNAINDTISRIKNIPIDTLREGEYLEDYLSRNAVSKVVDKNGEPMIVWHGTKHSFEEFELDVDNKRGKHLVHVNKGFFFTDSKKKALKYKNSNVIPAFLSAKNPGESSVVKDGVVNNVDKENKILLDDTYDSAIFIRFDKEGEEFGTKPTTQYVAKRPNQIKSIDNTGEFGETGNIFYKIMESVNKAEKELFNDRSIYNQRFYEKFKTFTDSSSAIKFLLDNGYIQEEYVKLAELLMAHSVKLSISKDFVNNGKLGSYTPGMKIGESSIELTKDTFTKRPDIVAEVLLHEVMHHYLGYRYDMDAEFKKRVDMLHKKYTSLATENEKKSFYGLSEGKEEFLIEAVTNSELRNWMQRKDKELESSLYNRLKRLIAKTLLLLGVHNANAYNLNDITGAITHMVENISKREAPLSERKYSKSEAVRRFGGLDINHVQNKKDSDYVRTMEQEAGVTRVRIEQGIKSRIKAFEQYGKATYNQVRVMEQELANLQELWQKNEDKEAMIRFINHAAREADKPIRAIDAAFEEYKATGKFSLRNNQLIQIYRDFIGFYEPVIENINEKLFTIGYFDDLSDTEYEFLGNSIGAVTQDFSRIKSKYSALLANRFGDIIIEAAKEYKMDEAVIRAYVQDHKNYTSEDISWFHTYVGDMKVTKDKTLNLIARKIADLKNEIDRQTVSKASEVLPVFQAVSGGKWQLLYEKDDKGKKTGYLVRDRKYGKFYAERDAYFDSLGEAPIGDKEALREWYAKRNEWLKEHSERRYKPEYYDLFNNMSFAAREARDKIQFEISSTLSKYMDLKGNVHVERISEDDWNKLQVMYQEKRRLSNTYNNDGSKKTGIDLDIAEELQVINEELNKNLSYKSNKERFEKVRAEKEASLSKEDYDRWYKRSTRWAYTEEFQKLLDSIDKRDYGLENPLYAELNEEKKELTKMYRNTHDFMINTKLMPDSVKKRIVEIDNILEEIRSKAERRKKEGLTFDKIAKIVYSNYYYAEKQHAIDMDETNPGYYEKWRKESHTINKKGKLVPHSYYNLMIPNDSKHMEFVPSREFTEIDPESPYWNDQYDINNPEPYQPKKSLYDNSEAYNKVMNDPKLKAIHEVVVNTMAEANEKISFLKRGNNYKLPQITGGAWAFIKANRGIVKGMSRFVRDKYFEDKDDDVDFNYHSYAPDGQPLDTIPTHYMRMLDDPSTITNNLAGALMEYYGMAVNFEKKQQVLPEIKIVQNQVKTRQVQPNWLESKLDRYTTYTPNTQSRASKRLDRFLETNIFGNKYNSIRVGKFNMVKALVGLKNYATLVNLGANIFVAAANVMGSAHQHFTEALTGVYYTPRTALIALRNSLYHMSSMLLHMGKTTHSDKLLSLMNMNQIARENSNMYKRLNYNRFARFLMNHLWYGMMTAGDVFTKGQILTSVYLNTKYVPEHDRFMMRDEYLMLHRDDKKAGKKFSKLNTMNLYDMYEASGINAVLKTGEKYERYHKYITPDLTNRVTNVTRYLAQRADGMMDDSSRNFAQANAVTGFVFMHKNFMLSAAEDRVLKATEYNFMLERVDEAQYRTVARRIKETVKYLWQAIKYYVFRKQAGVEKPTLRKTEFYENYNMKRVKIESSLVIAYMFISMILNSYRGDDDKWWMQAIKYAHDRATYEAGNLYNPMDLFNTFKALSPAASSLENAKTVALAITALLDSDSNIFKETKYGPYSGFRRVTKAAFKTTPLKNIIEATDPKSKHKYLKGQLQ